VLGTSNLADEKTGNMFRLIGRDEEVLVLLGRKCRFGPMRDAAFEAHEKAVSTD
jgi:hypothetical protein